MKAILFLHYSLFYFLLYKHVFQLLLCSIPSSWSNLLFQIDQLHFNLEDNTHIHCFNGIKVKLVFDYKLFLVCIYFSHFWVFGCLGVFRSAYVIDEFMSMTHPQDINHTILLELQHPMIYAISKFSHWISWLIFIYLNIPGTQTLRDLSQEFGKVTNSFPKYL